MLRHAAFMAEGRGVGQVLSHSFPVQNASSRISGIGIPMSQRKIERMAVS